MSESRSWERGFGDSESGLNYYGYYYFSSVKLRCGCAEPKGILAIFNCDDGIQENIQEEVIQLPRKPKKCVNARRRP